MTPLSARSGERATRPFVQPRLAHMRTRRVQIARFVASVLIVSGALLLADVAVTLAWQEPISALVAGHQQAQLRRQLKLLERLSAGDERALASIRGQPARLAGPGGPAPGGARPRHPPGGGAAPP